MASQDDGFLPIEKLNREELVRRFQGLKERAKKLEELVEIISRGKYMWEATFDAIGSPVQIVSLQFEVIRANLSFANICARDIAAVVGQRCFEVFAGRSKACDGCPLTMAIERDVKISTGLRCQIAERDFEVSVYPLGGAVLDSAVMYYNDITEEKRLQQEVIQQEKMAAIGMLAGGVAHEINNPLGGILAFAQLMKRDVVGNDHLIADIEEIERAAIRCKKIVADLLDFSRVSKDRDKQPVDINSLIEKVFPFIQREIKSLNVELIFDGAASLPFVLGIPDRLQQVFLNLMTNACQAVPKGGSLIVATINSKVKGFVEVVVKDTGTGIPQDIRDRIFDPFFTTKEPGKGTGLGLSISYRIVKEHGGEILCRDAKDGGAEFVIRLPVTDD